MAMAAPVETEKDFGEVEKDYISKQPPKTVGIIEQVEKVISTAHKEIARLSRGIIAYEKLLDKIKSCPEVASIVDEINTLDTKRINGSDFP